MKALRGVFDSYGDIADDIVQDTMHQLMRSGERLVPADVRDAWAYVRTVADRQRIDAHRRNARQLPPLVDLNAESIRDGIARFLDEHASKQTVIEAMARHRHLGQTLTLRVITVWIDLAEETGKRPSNRAVAERLGITHPTVKAHLDDFKDTLRALAADEI
jgi:DNA-directed RNA polymerase specialized sigma24 family protein